MQLLQSLRRWKQVVYHALSVCLLPGCTIWLVSWQSFAGKGARDDSEKARLTLRCVFQ